MHPAELTNSTLERQNVSCLHLHPALHAQVRHAHVLTTDDDDGEMGSGSGTKRGRHQTSCARQRPEEGPLVRGSLRLQVSCRRAARLLIFLQGAYWHVSFRNPQRSQRP